VQGPLHDLGVGSGIRVRLHVLESEATSPCLERPLAGRGRAGRWPSPPSLLVDLARRASRAVLTRSTSASRVIW